MRKKGQLAVMCKTNILSFEITMDKVLTIFTTEGDPMEHMEKIKYIYEAYKNATTEESKNGYYIEIYDQHNWRDKYEDKVTYAHPLKLRTKKNHIMKTYNKKKSNLVNKFPFLNNFYKESNTFINYVKHAIKLNV